MISPFWQTHQATIDPARFRESPAFLCSEGFDHRAYFDELLERKGTRIVLNALGDEDGAYGAEMIEHRGRVVSRDLLDSVTDLWFLSSLGLLDDPPPRVLDIGVGYGRLAHRIRQVAPRAEITGVDEVPAAIAACREYLDHRGVGDVPLFHELDDVPDPTPRGEHPFDLAISCHVWSECTLSTITRHLAWLHEHEIPRIFIVPHANPRSSPHLGLGAWSDEPGGGGGPGYSGILAALGYRLTSRATDPAGVDRMLFTHPEFSR